MRKITSLAALILLPFLLLQLGATGITDVEEVRSKASGAYNALNFWGDSRAYPGRDIPDSGFFRGWEYSKVALREAPDLRGTGASWEAIGPKNGGGRTLAVAFDPQNPSTVYAGAASGGLWRSTTGGVGAAAWQRIDTGHPVLGVSTIAFEPGNSSVMYIGTGEVYNHQMAGDLEADRRTRGSYGIGILKTVDGGATWTKSLDWSYNQRHGVWAVRVDPLDSNVVWAATTDGVYKSTNAGGSWTQKLSVVMVTDLVVHPATPDTVLAACGNLGSPGRGIYRTVDGGDNWSQVTGGGVPADFLGKVQFGVTPADPDVVYASIGNGYDPPCQGTNDYFTWLLRSDDFGATLSLRNTTDYSMWQGWYAQDVAVSPVDADTIICIGIDIWKSVDGGNTLTQKSFYQNNFTGDIPPGGPEGLPNYSHADHHDVVFHPTDGNVLYVGNDGGVFRSTDGGETYAGANGGYQSQQFYNGSYCSATNPDLAMGGLQDNASAIYRGNGNWSRFIFGGDGGWCGIDPTNPNIVYATAQFRFTARSTDGGLNFSQISPPDLGGEVAFMAPFVIAPNDSSILYRGSSYLFKSFDGGSNWFVGQGGTEIDGNPLLLLAVAPQNDDVVYMTTVPLVGPARVHRTLDGGSTFTEITGNLPDRYSGDLAVDPTDEATVYLTLSGFGSSHVFRSTNYGSTWTDIDQGILPDVPTTAVVIDPDFPDHIYVGNDIGVYFTSDHGSNWTQLDQGLTEAVLVHELNISPSNRKLRAFTHGRGVFERDLEGAIPPPTLTGVNPASGAVRGGNVITLTGQNFGNADVSFDGILGDVLGMNTATTLIVQVPDGLAEGDVDVTVSQATGQDTLVNGYTYTPNPVAIEWFGNPRLGFNVKINIFGPAGKRAGFAVGPPGTIVRPCCTFCFGRPLELVVRPNELTLGANGRAQVVLPVMGQLFDIKQIQGVVITDQGIEQTNCESFSILP